jgi:hypothetical protein
MRQMNQTGLFAGVREVVDKGLDLDNYTTKRSALRLMERGATSSTLVRDVFETLERNWHANSQRRGRSRQNFRWHYPQTHVSDHNTSAEVTLERALINALQQAHRDDWSNQVPLISGIEGSHSHRRRAVDLVHHHGDGTFEFVELKVDSDTPLFAAMEVMVYGLLWLLSRRNQPDSSKASPILQANKLVLSVLAPRAYYSGHDTQSIAKIIDDGVQAVSAQEGVSMQFRFTAFPSAFSWGAGPRSSGQELIDFLDHREVV